MPYPDDDWDDIDNGFSDPDDEDEEEDYVP